ncbi:MAG: methyltransferase [Thermococci archaeon]|nr:methyltransferase [Thermococci archaeon]
MGADVNVDVSEEIVNRLMELMRRGFDRKKILQVLGSTVSREEFEEAMEIAAARLRSGDKFSRDDLWMDLEGLRYATHEVVARYRAERLRRTGVREIADVSCGVGIQLIFYAMVVRHAYGIDVCPRRLRYAVKNAEKYGVADRITFINADSLDPKTVEAVDADVVYSDPARPPNAPERRLEDLMPSPLLVYRAYSGKTDSFIFDLPPQMERSRVPWRGEFEYIDLNGSLNRLTFYTEPLAETERRAVLLPRGVVIDRDPNLEPIVEVTDEPGEYVYEVSPAVDRADLINELFHAAGGQLKLLLREKRRTLATGDEVLDDRYFKRVYTTVAVVGFHPVRINEVLRREGFGRATLRVSVPPDRYWEIRKRIERGLSGDRRAFVFKVGDRALILEEAERG